jgi:glyoxylase-like metal-dependent hydrolase (beta-lactamase superfamily II)
MLSRGLITAVVCLSPVYALAQTTSPVTVINADAAKSEISTRPLRGNVSVLSGSGGNITVFTSPEGKFLVDDGIAVSREKIVAALAKLGPASVKYVVNTHWHWDHADGNVWVHDAGATIIGSANTRKYLSTTSRVDDWSYTFPPTPPNGLPTDVVSSSKTMNFGGETITIGTYVPSHTDGDLWVRFGKADVVAMGDTFWNGMYPFIDNAHGGGIDGMIRAVNATLDQVGDQTLIVPGHGSVGGRSDLVAFRDMLVGVRDNVAKLKKEGKTQAEAQAAKPGAGFDSKWGGGVINPDFFVHLVYAGL